MVCHKHCKEEIQFACRSSDRIKEHQNISHVPPNEKFDTIRRTLSSEQVHSRIQKYNTTVKNSFVMQLRKDYTFTGYIRVEMELTRPITVIGERKEILYLPRKTVKAIYLTSQTTAAQVIGALLQKFKVTNDPRRFMLCERIQKDQNDQSHVTIRPMSENERPLFLTLLWGSAHSGHGFRLKDQMDSEPVWFDFEEHELAQFHKLYEEEKQKAIKDVKETYEVRRYQIHKILTDRREPLVSPN